MTNEEAPVAKAKDDVYFSRRKARKHAVEIGYAALIRDADPISLLRESVAQLGWSKHPWFGYCERIVTGVGDEFELIDERLASASERWSLDRMSRIDLAILRVGAWEIEYNQEVPDGVAISEAVQLARELSTDQAAKFINGVLGKIAAEEAE